MIIFKEASVITRDLIYIVFAYLCGSVLFARVFGQIFYRHDVTQDGGDRNPGTFNAFKFGGFWMGLLTLIGDLAKGIIPVFMYTHGLKDKPGFALAFVIAAPVIGHAFPIFSHFKGGIGIAVSFGTLLGLYPNMLPVLFLAATFVFFSVVVKISPHYYRTIAAFSVAILLIFVFSDSSFAITVGFLISAVCVNIRLYRSTQEKQSLEVKLAWKH